jgi:hypothetical protein
MNAPLQVEGKVAPRSSFAPVRTGFLQRKCACGGSPGLSGECEECRKKRLTRERRATNQNERSAPPIVQETPRSPVRDTLESRFGHDFGQVRVWAASPIGASRASASLPRSDSVSGAGFALGTKEEPRPLLRVAATAEGCGPCEQEAAHRSDYALSTGEQPEDAELADNLVNGVIATAALPCYGRGGNSVCNPDTGNYDIDYNDNTCCTRDCTQRHEERHVSDLQDCCQALHAKIAAGGDRNALIRQYNTWMGSGTVDWTECNAYTVSVDCARDMWTDNNCDRVCSQCCTEIQDYLNLAEAQHRKYCGRAPGSRPACPF